MSGLFLVVVAIVLVVVSALALRARPGTVRVLVGLLLAGIALWLLWLGAMVVFAGRAMRGR